jgi:decaprenyl-phosphate phosphoribosyltransferase
MPINAQPVLEQKVLLGTRIRAHIAIARFDHIAKNAFILPGVLIPLTIQPDLLWRKLVIRILIGFAASSLVACSNYVINEVLDAPFDRFHPTKSNRPVVAGLVNVPLAYVQWIVMMAAGISLGWLVSKPFVAVLAALWIMGCIYNIPPIRTKDLPYLDVLSESLNNPLRMLLGWYMVTTILIPPVSLLVSYWMVGCYFMALKRTSEFRDFADKSNAAAYRKSFRYYSEESLMVSVMFYASAAMLFFGAFIMRYRVELILSFPLVAYVMAVYLRLSNERGSAVQNPEKLHRSSKLMVPVFLCAVVMLILLRVDIPWMANYFKPTLPVRSGHSEAGR